MSTEKTEFIENYLAFWNSLAELYSSFTDKITKKGIAHQGYVYREAANSMEHYLLANRHKKHIFIGFNALNNAEQQILKELLESGNGEVFWDSDRYFMEKEHHSASLFLRGFKEQWKYYKNNEFKHISNNYDNPKEIDIIGCSKSVGQTKYVSEILKNLSKEELENTALVLTDEKLLLPILNSLPENVESVNITMGMPLKELPIVTFFEAFLQLHQDGEQNFYYKDLYKILNHPLGKISIPETGKKIIKSIKEKNLTQISSGQILEIAHEVEKEAVYLLFSSQTNKVSTNIQALKQIILHIKDQKIVKSDGIILESLFKLYQVCNQLETLNLKFQHIQTTKALLLVFKELIETTNLDFKGEPYRGLQILGILETRGLDFKNVILVSVNEGILPAGKSNRSFITFDLKTRYQLPTHREKDAIYTYHFYRLLHRATKVYLLYNNHTSGIQIGEKSRFLLQMEYDSPKTHIIHKKTVTPQMDINSTALKQVQKTPEVLQIIKAIAVRGFSPSSLTTYIRNPMDFYTQYILRIRDLEDVEETIAANTMGTVVHDTLQVLYEPYLEQTLSLEILAKMQSQADREVTIQFSKTFREGNLNFGKNLITYEMAKRYVQSILKEEIKSIKSGNKIILKQIEKNLEAIILFTELDFPVKIQGKVDRIDSLDGMLRIIDYKTGKVEQKDLNLSAWEDITTDYKYSKSFQVLAYALMVNETFAIQDARAGIISFKNLKSGFLSFSLKEGKLTSDIVTQETLNNFRKELKTIILEICNPDIPLIEKEIL